MKKIYCKFISHIRQKLIHSVFIKKWLYRIYWLIPDYCKKPNKLRTELLAFSNKNKNVFFVEIGANDGLSNDSLREFIVTQKWKGLMVEPVPYVFEKLEKVYRKKPGIILENIAVSDFNGKANFWFVDKTKDLKSGEDQVGSFNKKTVLNSIKTYNYSNKHIIKKNINCITLDKLLTKNKIGKIDVLSIDAEGYDYRIIKQIDFKKINPKLILFEQCHLSLKEKNECFKLLTVNGYKIQDAKDTANIIATKYL